MLTTLRLLALLLLLSLPGAIAVAQEGRGYLLQPPPYTLTVWGGYAAPRAESEVFAFSFDELTMTSRDLRSAALGVEYSQTLSGRTRLVLGLGYARASHPSELRDYVDENDLPIRQTTDFVRTTVGGALRFHLVPPGRTVGSFAWIPARLVPWLSLGGGALNQRFEQRGEFVDEGTLDIFVDRFTSEGWTPFVEAAVGLDVNLNPRYALGLSGRYTSASARMNGDFVGFDRIDLSGFNLTLGLTVRF